MNKDQFKDVTRTWLSYWDRPPLNDIRAKEYWARFGSWTEKRYAEAHQTHSDSGKKWPEKMELISADKTNRIEIKSKRTRTPDAEVADHINHAFDLFRTRIGDANLPIDDSFTTLVPMEPMIAKAKDVYDNVKRPEGYSDRAFKELRRSYGFGSLSYMVRRQIRGFL